MALDLTEPNQILLDAIIAAVDLEYPSLPEDDPGYEERELLRKNEIRTRYDTQRWAEILADRATLPQFAQDEIAAVADEYPEVKKSGRVLRHGELEAIWRKWATNNVARRDKLKEEAKQDARQYGKSLVETEIPDWRMDVLQHRNLSLLNISLQRALTAQEISQVQNLQAQWDWIKDVHDFAQTVIDRIDGGENVDLDAEPWPPAP